MDFPEDIPKDGDAVKISRKAQKERQVDGVKNKVSLSCLTRKSRAVQRGKKVKR